MDCVECLKEYDWFLFSDQKEPLPREAAHHLEVCENCRGVAVKLKRSDEECRSKSYPGEWKMLLLFRLAPVIKFCGEIDVWKVLWRTFPAIAVGLPLAVLGAIVLPDPKVFLIALGTLSLAFHAWVIATSKRPLEKDPLLEPLPESVAPLVSVSRLIAFAEGRLPLKETGVVMLLVEGYPDVAHDLKLVTAALKHARGDANKGLLPAIVSRN